MIVSFAHVGGWYVVVTRLHQPPVLVSVADSDEALRLANALRSLLSEAFEFGQGVTEVTAA